MANPKHLKQLKQGIDEWNQWRGKSQVTQPDLSQTDLIEVDLRGADLSGADLSRTDLRGANLRGVNLRKADLSGVNLSRFATDEIDLHGVDLRDANLSEANLSGAHMSGIDLRGANLSGANLRDANLSEANLNGISLDEADPYRADLSEADLRDAHMSGIDLSGIDLSRADLSRADLSNSFMGQVNLSGANLDETDLSGVHLLGSTLAKIDLRTTKGLSTITYIGASHIELFSVQLPQDGSALHFLRGVGVSDEWIDYYRANMMHPIQYYSCFISYSSKDEPLAKYLHADLQAEGVRCWFAPEDLKIGDKFRNRIDEAIHRQDKLLLLLSKHSIRSEWIETEVEVAQEKERKQKREVLFPVRLDESIVRTRQPWAKHLRLKCHIGDFTKWTDPQAYQVAFARLLHDLKQE